jgi:subtilisin family serine protease
MAIINKFKISVTPLILNNGEPLITRRDLVSDFIDNNLPFLNKIRLANVRIKEDEVEFQSVSNESLKPLEDLSLNERREILKLYNKALYDLDIWFRSQNDLNNTSIKDWEEILKKIFNPANNIIYVKDKNLTLLWGCAFNNAEENFLHKNEFLETEDINNNSNGEVPQSIGLSSNIELKPLESSEINNNHTTLNNFVAKTNETIIIRSNKKNSRSFGSRLLAGLIDLIYRGWWFILLLIFLFIWLNSIFCFACSANKSFSFNKERQDALSYLPPIAGINIPIDSLDVGYDDDSVFLIANNRVNAALKNKQNEFFKFVNELGSSFLNKNRKIIYYNEETARIQIEFDLNSDTNIKEDLRKAVPDYDLLIWDESVFVNTYQGFNDPLLDRPEINWYLDLINMGEAWRISKGNKDVVVAVVDDGFDLTHPELKNATITKQYNVIEQRNQVFGNNVLKHGTHVSTTLLGAANNHQGLSGIAPNVSFMPIQIGSQDRPYLTNTDIIDGILYALKNKASIISLSLGKQLSPSMINLSEPQQRELIKNFGKDEELFWAELFSIAEKQNTTIVIAAGNDGVLSGIDPMQRYSNAIIVGAVDKNKKLASFSNHGEYNTINAPGVQIVSAIPGNNFEPMDGTSMATPIVSGAVALYKSVHPSATNTEIKRKLNSSAQAGKILDVELFLN